MRNIPKLINNEWTILTTRSHQHSLEYITVHDTDEVFLSRRHSDLRKYLEDAVVAAGGKEAFTHLWLKDAYFVPFKVARLV